MESVPVLPLRVFHILELLNEQTHSQPLPSDSRKNNQCNDQAIKGLLNADEILLNTGFNLLEHKQGFKMIEMRYDPLQILCNLSASNSYLWVN